jgi:hypothetical protein
MHSKVDGRDTQTDRKQGDLISLLLFFQNKETRPKRLKGEFFITSGKAGESPGQMNRHVRCPVNTLQVGVTEMRATLQVRKQETETLRASVMPLFKVPSLHSIAE